MGKFEFEWKCLTITFGLKDNLIRYWVTDVFNIYLVLSQLMRRRGYRWNFNNKLKDYVQTWMWTHALSFFPFPLSLPPFLNVWITNDKWILYRTIGKRAGLKGIFLFTLSKRFRIFISNRFIVPYSHHCMWTFGSNRWSYWSLFSYCSAPIVCPELKMKKRENPQKVRSIQLGKIWISNNHHQGFY